MRGNAPARRGAGGDESDQEASERHIGCESEVDEDPEEEREDASTTPTSGEGGNKQTRYRPNGHSSRAWATAKNPERNRYDRARPIATEITGKLKQRADINLDILCMVIEDLSIEERIEFRSTPSMQVEQYLTRRETFDWLKAECFNAKNAIDLRACEALPVRQMQRMNERLMCSADGKRRMYCEPPSYKGQFNVLQRQKLRGLGIKDGSKLYVPPIFPSHREVLAAADKVLDGRRIFLATDFDGAAWDITRMARDLLTMLDNDGNLHALPQGKLRVIQLIYDGHGFTSASGAVRFCIRTPHTKRDHNATQNAFDPIFFIGSDKHLYLEKAVSIGGEDSLRSHAYAGLEVTEMPISELPNKERENEHLAPLLRLRCKINMQIPGSTPGTTETVRCKCSGDCAAAHAGWALESPVWRQGCCLRCTAPKTKWIDDEAIDSAWKRTFVYQCVANHINPYPLLPGCDSAGKPYRERPPPICPHCGKTVDEHLEKKESAELQAAPSNAKRQEIQREHAKGHAGGLCGRIPILPMEQRDRSRGLLHRRMNVASNCLMATFLARPFSEKERIEANALLRQHKMIWRFPEKAGKCAKGISAGNDSRRLFSNPPLLVGLMRIFYTDVDEHIEQLNVLVGEAAANTAVRSEDEPAAEAPAPKPPAARRKDKAASVQQPAGIAKKRTVKKKPVATVLAPGGKSVDEEQVKEYARKRRQANAQVTEKDPDRAQHGDASEVQGVDHEQEQPADADTRDGKGDSSLEVEDDGIEDELEEDEKCGGAKTAIEVWLTAIRYMAALHASVDDPFDEASIKSYACTCKLSGRAWAVKINEHTSNRALWQYVHDAFAHIEEDILENGVLDRNDDSILEKGNRRKKRLGDRCCFRGGKNGHPASGRATYQQRRRVKQRDFSGKWTGQYVFRTVTRIANLGSAAQVLKLDLIAQLCEAARKTAKDNMSERQKESMAEKKLIRQEQRDATENAVMKYALKFNAPHFSSFIIAELPEEEQKALADLEKKHMASQPWFTRNGDEFEAYFDRHDLTVHLAKSAEGELYGFAISGADARGMYFLYELHVAKVVRGCGIGTLLLNLVDKRTWSSGRAGKVKRVTVELNVHAENEAREYYRKVGFKLEGELPGGVIVMRRVRDLPD